MLANSQAAYDRKSQNKIDTVLNSVGKTTEPRNPG
jgi:hypothetical protein